MRTLVLMAVSLGTLAAPTFVLTDEIQVYDVAIEEPGISI